MKEKLDIILNLIEGLGKKVFPLVKKMYDIVVVWPLWMKLLLFVLAAGVAFWSRARRDYSLNSYTRPGIVHRRHFMRALYCTLFFGAMLYALPEGNPSDKTLTVFGAAIILLVINLLGSIFSGNAWMILLHLLNVVAYFMISIYATSPAAKISNKTVWIGLMIVLYLIVWIIDTHFASTRDARASRRKEKKERKKRKAAEASQKKAEKKASKAARPTASTASASQNRSTTSNAAAPSTSSKPSTISTTPTAAAPKRSTPASSTTASISSSTANVPSLAAAASASSPEAAAGTTSQSAAASAESDTAYVSSHSATVSLAAAAVDALYQSVADGTPSDVYKQYSQMFEIKTERFSPENSEDAELLPGASSSYRIKKHLSNVHRISTGNVIRYNDVSYLVLGIQYSKPGKGAAYIALKLYDWKNEKIEKIKARSTERISVESYIMKAVEYMGSSNDNVIDSRELSNAGLKDREFYFRDLDTQETYTRNISRGLLEELQYVKKYDEMTAIFTADEEFICVIPEQYVTCCVKMLIPHPFLKDAYMALLDTGANVAVPDSVKEGDYIKVDTETNQYVIS